MNNLQKVGILIGMLVVATFGKDVIDSFDTDDTPDVPPVIVVIDEPSSDNKKLVQPIQLMNINDEDRVVLRDFYDQLSQIIEGDGELETPVISNLGQFRSYHMKAGMLNGAGTDLKGKYASLADAVEEAIVAAVSKKNLPLDDDVREKLVNVVSAVSWAIENQITEKVE